ncbi:TIR domain-containing protein [Cohnella silvisoli]|uniref:TIR domain-containing protein n=1 Tax=Cohnella silvisoli TaxID=2873699 RepID=A0ABV1KN42_9BACL|nr:TIR domain-containing protein [Cohnella silvisoli]MCD9020221.1 TIR domain-containing protein [Cohnella silvisoli]
MPVFFVNPTLTIGEEKNALLFFDECSRELQEHIDTVPIIMESVLHRTHPTQGDGVVFFNRADNAYSETFIDFIQDATLNRVEVFPISISRDHRFPPQQALQDQSFDVIENLRHRSLTEANIDTISCALARSVVSKLQPTLSKDRMHLFISHRRLDGEEIAAAFCRELRARAESVFRDLIDIRVGEEAQELIEENLRKSDAVIFLDTPKSYESNWIQKELRIALSINLPIVWVKIGSNEGRGELPISPAESPHFEFPDMDITINYVESTLVDAVIHKAFQISREHAIKVFDPFRRLKSLARSGDVTLQEIDKKTMLYKVHVPRKGFRYTQRPMTHLIQLYGRFPKEDDKAQFHPLVDGFGFNSHPKFGRYYDSALLLGPIPDQQTIVGEECVVDSLDEYVRSLEQYVKPYMAPIQKKKRGVIISGAFPDCEPEYQQQLTNAIHAVTQEILERKGIVIFGGHPTFQHIIFDLAKRYNPSDFKDDIHLYLSKFFVAESGFQEYSKHATVFAIEVIKGERNKSLTLMRKCMIGDNEALGLIALGGKTKAGGHSPGVDEEITLAQEKGLPVYLIGSVGGRTAEIAVEMDQKSWEPSINTLSTRDNQELMKSLDYQMLSKNILDQIGI